MTSHGRARGGDDHRGYLHGAGRRDLPLESPRHLVGYLGLDPRVRRSGNRFAFTGWISMEGSALVRHMVVEAAHSATRNPGPLKALPERTRARRGHNIAIEATPRKMVALIWHLLNKEEDYRYSIERTTSKKIRKVELLAGSPRKRGGGSSKGPNREEKQRMDRERAERAEGEYRRIAARSLASQTAAAWKEAEQTATET